jgi:nucleoside-diphosphate-sugar epimerase
MGVRKPWNLPKALIWPVGLLAEVMARLFGARHAPFCPGPGSNCFSIHSIQHEKAEKSLHFFPVIRWKRALKNTVRYIKRMG